MARIKYLFENFRPFSGSSRPFARWSLSLLFLLPGLAATARAEEKTAEASEAEAARESAILSDIPPDQVYHGLRIPHMDQNGKLLMLFDAESAKRIDDKHIEMENLKIEIHNDDGTTFHVQMPHSVFNLDTRVLESDTRAIIKREDFVIEGDTAQFETKTRFGRMRGNVKMTIESENNE